MSRDIVLLDAGPLVALLNHSDQHHQRCADAVESLADDIVTCEAVVNEACHILRKVRGAAHDILANIRRGYFTIDFSLALRAISVSRLMAKYADQPMSLADACLVDMATKLGSGRILTLDSDFRVYRWGRNRPFELVLDV